MVVEDDDYVEEDSMTWSSEIDCFRSDDPKDSIYFTSDNDEDSDCSNPSGSEDSWDVMFDFIFFLAMKIFQRSSSKFNVALHVRKESFNSFDIPEFKYRFCQFVSNASREQERSTVWHIRDTEHSVEANTA